MSVIKNAYLTYSCYKKTKLNKYIKERDREIKLYPI